MKNMFFIWKNQRGHFITQTTQNELMAKYTLFQAKRVKWKWWGKWFQLGKGPSHALGLKTADTDVRWNPPSPAAWDLSLPPTCSLFSQGSTVEICILSASGQGFSRKSQTHDSWLTGGGIKQKVVPGSRCTGTHSSVCQDHTYPLQSEAYVWHGTSKDHRDQNTSTLIFHYFLK